SCPCRRWAGRSRSLQTLRVAAGAGAGAGAGVGAAAVAGEAGLAEAQGAHELRGGVVDPVSESGGVDGLVIGGQGGEELHGGDDPAGVGEDLGVLDDLSGDALVISVELGGRLEDGDLLDKVLESKYLRALAGRHVAPDLDGVPEVPRTQIADERRPHVKLLLLEPPGQQLREALHGVLGLAGVLPQPDPGGLRVDGDDGQGLVPAVQVAGLDEVLQVVHNHVTQHLLRVLQLVLLEVLLLHVVQVHASELYRQDEGLREEPPLYADVNGGVNVAGNQELVDDVLLLSGPLPLSQTVQPGAARVGVGDLGPRDGDPAAALERSPSEDATRAGAKETGLVLALALAWGPKWTVGRLCAIRLLVETSSLAGEVGPEGVGVAAGLARLGLPVRRSGRGVALAQLLEELLGVEGLVGGKLCGGPGESREVAAAQVGGAVLVAHPRKGGRGRVEHRARAVLLVDGQELPLELLLLRDDPTLPAQELRSGGAGRVEVEPQHGRDVQTSLRGVLGEHVLNQAPGELFIGAVGLLALLLAVANKVALVEQLVEYVRVGNDLRVCGDSVEAKLGLSSRFAGERDQLAGEGKVHSAGLVVPGRYIGRRAGVRGEGVDADLVIVGRSCKDPGDDRGPEVLHAPLLGVELGEDLGLLVVQESPADGLAVLPRGQQQVGVNRGELYGHDPLLVGRHGLLKRVGDIPQIPELQRGVPVVVVPHHDLGWLARDPRQGRRPGSLSRVPERNRALLHLQVPYGGVAVAGGGGHDVRDLWIPLERGDVKVPMLVFLARLIVV
ncbi:hypothetical protein OIY81_3283, partial [Cryptosporidium canis]